MIQCLSTYITHMLSTFDCEYKQIQKKWSDKAVLIWPCPRWMCRLDKGFWNMTNGHQCKLHKVLLSFFFLICGHGIVCVVFFLIFLIFDFLNAPWYLFTACLCASEFHIRLSIWCYTYLNPEILKHVDIHTYSIIWCYGNVRTGKIEAWVFKGHNYVEGCIALSYYVW